MPKHEVIIELPKKAHVWELSEIMVSLGWEGYVTVQVRQEERHVRFGVAPYHHEVRLSEPKEGDQDILVLYLWDDSYFYLVRGKDEEIVQSVKWPSSIDFTSEEVGQVVRELCAQTDNQCRRVHVTLGKYHGSYKMLDFLSLLDRVAPSKKLRLFGLDVTERQFLDTSLRALPTSFLLNTIQSSSCYSESYEDAGCL